MKKLSAVLLAIFLLATLTLTATAADSASATLSGPKTVRAGDTIKLVFSINGAGLFGATGELSYDTNQVTLVETKSLAVSPWMVEFADNMFVIYDNGMETPINKNTQLFSATFKVKKLGTGTPIKITCRNVMASDGTADSAIGEVAYEIKVSAPTTTTKKPTTSSTAKPTSTTKRTTTKPISSSTTGFVSSATTASTSQNTPSHSTEETILTTGTTTTESSLATVSTRTTALQTDVPPSEDGDHTLCFVIIGVEALIICILLAVAIRKKR